MFLTVWSQLRFEFHIIERQFKSSAFPFAIHSKKCILEVWSFRAEFITFGWCLYSKNWRSCQLTAKWIWDVLDSFRWSFLPEGRLGHITNHKRFQILTLCNSPSCNSISHWHHNTWPTSAIGRWMSRALPKVSHGSFFQEQMSSPVNSMAWSWRLPFLPIRPDCHWQKLLSDWSAWWLIDRPSWQWSERDKVFRGVVRERRQITEWSDQVWKKLKKCLGNF